jgi:hypothetical protein
MTMTDVQAVIGPPYAIKSLRWREVLFYCPSSWLGIPIGEPSYTTVWMVHRRVVAFRSLIESNSRTCEQFIAAFQWTDPPPFLTAQHRSEWNSQSHDGGARVDRPTDWRPSREPAR